MVPTLGTFESAPNTSSAIRRARLCHAFASSAEQLVVVSAPAGYGKSFLACQFAVDPRFDHAVWVDSSVDEGGSSLPVAAAQALEAALSVRLGPREPCQDSASDDGWSEVVSWIGRCSGQRLVVVLDDVSLDGCCSRDIQHLARLVSSTSADSKLVCTTRCRVPSGLFGDCDAWFVESAELRLSLEEAAQLAGTLGSSMKRDEVRGAWESCGGQAAMMSVLLRNSETSTRLAGVPADIRLRLVGLAEKGVPPGGMNLLYALALLRRGTHKDLQAIFGEDVPCCLRGLAEAIPLVSVSRTTAGDTFVIHDYACQAFGSAEFARRYVSDGERVLAAVLAHLRGHGRDARAFRLLLGRDDTERLVAWLAQDGERLLEQGHLQLLTACLDRVPLAVLVAQPLLVRLQAAVARDSGSIETAFERAKLAVELCEYDGDSAALGSALQLLARVEIDQGNLRSAIGCLRRVLEMCPAMDAVSRSMTYSYLTVCHGHLGELAEAREAHRRATDESAKPAVDPGTQGYVRHAGTIIPGLLLGQWSSTVGDDRRTHSDRRLPAAFRLLALNNECFSLTMMGRHGESESMLAEASERAEELGLAGIRMALRSGQALVAAAMGDYENAESLSRPETDGCENDASSRAVRSIYRGQWLRASGREAEALADVEDAVRALEGTPDLAMVGLLARIEEAACRLALDDLAAALTRASQASDSLVGLPANYHHLIADLVLAEIARREGRAQEAVARLLEHSEYVLTESANLVIAFYVRAFPGLLGILGSAIGPSRLPSHMLRLITGQDADEALTIAWSEMPLEEWRELSTRMLGDEDAESFEATLDGGVPCVVRLFGGLEVDTPDGRIPDRAWRKRKARLLLAMLVARKGQDVPREQLLEYLWPDMSEQKARNNFYVIWNTLKGALSPNLPKGENCPYIESVGGLCRVDPELVRSDLDTFEALLVRARDAEAAGDSARAIVAYRELETLYRGDLLPGDVYDDWFGGLRDRCRQQFGDAMIQASRLLCEAGQGDATLLALRKGLDQDPLREDLYQELLRCQIGAGQRSAAIETYLSCRSYLADELGLDPSNETRLLYDQVLAMEEGEPGPVSL